MSDVADRLRGAVRWSMASRCARQASYGLLGVEPTPFTARESGRMARGRDAGHYFARQMAAKHGEENVIFEMGVPWPAPPALPVGELHIDVGLISERIAIEAKNSIYVDSMYDAAIIQLAGALHFGREHFDSGLLVFLDQDYQITHEFPVFLTDELVEKVEEIAAAVIAAGHGGDLPERVCSKPADARGHFCPFAEHCFEGWIPPDPVEREDLSQLASEAWLVQRDLKAAKTNEKELQERWDEMKARLAEAVPEGSVGEIFAGPVKIKRIDVKARETFSKAKAVTAGVWTDLDDERFGPFVKLGEPSVRFDLHRMEGGGDLDLDFDEGGVPF